MEASPHHRIKVKQCFSFHFLTSSPLLMMISTLCLWNCNGFCQKQSILGNTWVTYDVTSGWKMVEKSFFLRMSGITGGNSSCILISMQVCGFVFSYFLFVVMHASLDSMLVVARVPLYLQKQDDVSKFPKLKSIVPFFPLFSMHGCRY